MARTSDPAARATRADAFVEAAQRLIQTKGYGRTSIQDVLDETASSRGAFYHYFDSKEALLQAVVERITDTALAAVEPLVHDETMPAPEKLRELFAGIGRWKMERSDLMRAILETWIADDNAIVRAKFGQGLQKRLGPVLTTIVAQGKAEGTFAVRSPAAAARVLVSLIAAVNETATELFVTRQAGRPSLEEVEATLVAYFNALERVLGVPDGAFTVFDRGLLREWFAPEALEEEG